MASNDRPNPVAPKPVPVPVGEPRYDASLLAPDDLYLFNEGNHTRLYERLGSHPRVVDGVAGTSFAFFAPNAEAISVMGDFNGWDKDRHPLARIGDSGLWEAFLPGVGRGAVYKYHLRSRLVRSKIGYMSQKFTLYDALTVKENLEFYAAIYEIPKRLRKEKVDWAIEACHLESMTKSIVGRLPRGWKRTAHPSGVPQSIQDNCARSGFSYSCLGSRYAHGTHARRVRDS